MVFIAGESGAEVSSEGKRLDRVERRVLRKIWKFVEFKSPENWEIAKLGYFCSFTIKGNLYICHIMYFNSKYEIRLLSRNRVTFFEFDFAIPDAQKDELAKKFAALYKKIDVFLQGELAKEKEELLTRFLRESNRIRKHMPHTDRPGRKKW